MGACCSTSDRMHSQLEGALKTQRIKSSFSRAAKNCLTRYVRNYSVRSARGPCGKPIKAESWEFVLAGSAMRVKRRMTHDIATSFRQRSARDGAIFREHDEASMREMAQVQNDDAAYVSLARLHMENLDGRWHPIGTCSTTSGNKQLDAHLDQPRLHSRTCREGKLARRFDRQ